MAKIKSNSKISKQIRNRVRLHREWNRILIKDAILSETRSNVNCERFSIATTSQEQIHHTQEEKTSGVEDKIRRWAVKYNISKGAVTDLLKILISVGFIWLPKDSRTLLQTPRNIELTTLTKGKLW